MKTSLLLLSVFFAAVLVTSYISCKKEEFSPEIKVQVVNSRTKNIVPGASVSIRSSNKFHSNNTSGVTDANGLLTSTINLGEYLADSILFFVTKEGYAPLSISQVVGNVQKTVYELAIDPLEGLTFNPNPANLLPTEYEKNITIYNAGVKAVECKLSVTEPDWMSVDSSVTAEPIPSGTSFKLRIITLPNDQQCERNGFITILHQGVRDSIPVRKTYSDTEIPTAFFNFSGPNPFKFFQDDIILFDASGSSDNCSSNLQYAWSFEGNNFSPYNPADKFKQHAFQGVGDMIVRLKVLDGANNASPEYSQLIKIEEKPTSPILASLVANPSAQLLAIDLSCNLVSLGNTYTHVDQHGFVWSVQNSEPKYGDCAQCEVDMGEKYSTGTFFTTVGGLTPNQTYYVRAFAKNATGITYFPESGAIEIIPHFLDYAPIGNPNGSGPIYFTLGDDASTYADQIPAKTVVLNPFKITKTEITNEQYAAFLHFKNINNPTQASAYIQIGSPYCKIKHNGGVEWVPEVGFENKPVVTVSYLGATEFCSWEGGYLPTEAQWECVALHKNDPYTYSGSNNCGNVAWYNFNSGGQVQPVGLLASNGYGVFDMSGNVMEWCKDWYGNYSFDPAPNPSGPSSGTCGYFARIIQHRRTALQGKIPVSRES